MDTKIDTFDYLSAFGGGLGRPGSRDITQTLEIVGKIDNEAI